MGRSVLILLCSALIGVSAAVAPAAAGAPETAQKETQYVGEQRDVSAEAAAAASEVGALNVSDEALFRASGKRLLAATDQAIGQLRSYRDATTRHGTDEEWKLVNRMLKHVCSGFKSYETVTEIAASDRPRDAIARQLRRILRSELTELIRPKIEEAVDGWLDAEAVDDLLTAPALRVARDRLILHVERRLVKEANALERRTINVGLDFGRPLGPQLKELRRQFADRARQAAIRWLARTIFKANPTGLVVQFAGRVIVGFIEEQLKAALRGRGNLQRRTQRTVKGFDNRQDALQALIDDAQAAKLADVHQQLQLANRALRATTYLKRDLKRVRNRSKNARRNFRAINTGEKRLQKRIDETRAAFLLDSKLANADFAESIDKLRRKRRQLRRIIKRLPKPAPATGVLTTALCPASINWRDQNWALEGEPLTRVVTQEWLSCQYAGPGGRTISIKSQRDPDVAQSCGRQDDPANQHFRNVGFGWSRKLSFEVFVAADIENADAVRATLIADAEAADIAAPCRPV